MEPGGMRYFCRSEGLSLKNQPLISTGLLLVLWSSIHSGNPLEGLANSSLMTTTLGMRKG